MNVEMILSKDQTAMIRRTAINQGVWPVVITPFLNDGAIDWNGYDSLLDWYIANGVSGLFAVCLSSEMYELTEPERLELARHTVRHAGHSLPIAACGGIGSTRKERFESIMRMAETGVNAVVIPVCQLVPREAPEAELVGELDYLATHADGVVLGIYECPAPYHRLLSADVFREPAMRNHISFVKDTCCDVTKIGHKLALCSGSPIKLFNANTTTYLASLRLGCAGYSGTSANFYPALLQKMFNTFTAEPSNAEHLQMHFIDSAIK